LHYAAGLRCKGTDAVRPTPDLIDLVYDSALDAAVWPRLLEQLADFFGSGATILLFQNQITMQGDGITVRLEDGALRTFYGHYAARNPLTARNDLSKIKNAKAFSVIVDEHIIEKRAFARTEYYTDFFAAHEMHHALMVTIGVRGQSVATLNLTRQKRHEQFDSEAMTAARALQPHLARSFRIGLELAEARQANSALVDSMEHSRYGLFLLDDTGRVWHANGRAEGMLGDGITTINGELTAQHPETSRKLHKMIDAACVARVERPRVGGTLSVPRKARRALSLIVTPLKHEAVPLAISGPTALVIVSDPEAGIMLPADGLKELFGLTPAEAAVALELLAGYDTKAVARRLGLSVHTVRVHLARIMSKTHTSRQAELMRLLTSIMGMI